MKICIPPSPPRIKQLIYLVFLSSCSCEFLRSFRDFAPHWQRRSSRRDEFVRHQRRWWHANLVCAFWWYGSLLLGRSISGERARYETRDAAELRATCNDSDRDAATAMLRHCAWVRGTWRPHCATVRNSIVLRSGEDAQPRALGSDDFTTMTPMSAKDIREIVWTHPSC